MHSDLPQWQGRVYTLVDWLIQPDGRGGNGAGVESMFVRVSCCWGCAVISGVGRATDNWQRVPKSVQKA